MRGVPIIYGKLGVLLKDGRLRKGLELEEASMLIGITNGSYLWRCEKGVSNFPARSLGRALELYDIPVADSVIAITEDFKSGLIDFLRHK